MNCRVHGSQVGCDLATSVHRTVDAFSFNCYPIRLKALDFQSFIPHTLVLIVSCPKIM